MITRFNLKQGDILINDDLMERFKCSGQGGMRKSNKTNTLVLISDETKGLYEDKWYGDEFHYTGMGKKGDQSLDFMQNKTLAQSNVNGVEVHLFEVFEKKKYTYVGQVKLNGEPYQAIQKDEDGLDRNVWIFKLRLIDEYEIPKVRQEIINQNTKQKERKAKKLSNEDLKEKAKEVKGKPGTRNTVSETYNRNAYVVEYTRRRANGICELCGKEAPFKNSKGEPYLEVHHIVWLSKGGDDTIENTAALCPNCHRKMHIINDEEDVEYLRNKIY
ncbi:HNH endonuclease [[Clostridium] sordellii]|uniref:HNH endonuclease n=1 Tax=Paraclostridium sordellii TaxID=1505 RepID=UPI0005E2F5AF|nr:HNH endonuclease signature motif containing protein [Paeniclostridium sordellii]CEQ29970.1 HNH endonuclease [[Clostridium] sordellii] [Paeniclostridium sordellii]